MSGLPRLFATDSDHVESKSFDRGCSKNWGGVAGKKCSHSANKSRITKKSQKNGNYVASLAVKKVASLRGMLTICKSN